MEFRQEYKVINSKNIISDPSYQRPINQARISKMMAEFDPNVVNPPKVSLRDGKFFVFDGQHTIALLKSINNCDVNILCKVFYGMAREDEAKYFEKQFGVFRKPSTTEMFKSAYNRGQPEHKEIMRLTEAHGFIVSFNKAMGENRIIALNTLYMNFIKYGPHIFEEALIVLRGAWDGQSSSLCQEILNGLPLFCFKFFGKYDRQTLIKKLKKLDPEKLVREGKASDKKGADKYLYRILAEYNKNQKTNRLEDEL